MSKICVQHETFPWMEPISGEQNVIPVALSKNKPISDDLVHVCTNMTSATNSVQLDADSWRIWYLLSMLITILWLDENEKSHNIEE